MVSIDKILSFCSRILHTLLSYTHDKIKYITPIYDNKYDFSVLTDELRLKQIILNLLSNAVKFTKTGYIKLYTYIENNQLIISIQDTGLGIKLEDLDKLFKENNMLDSHIDINKMGSGLGLYIYVNILLIN